MYTCIMGYMNLLSSVGASTDLHSEVSLEPQVKCERLALEVT